MVGIMVSLPPSTRYGISGGSFRNATIQNTSGAIIRLSLLMVKQTYPLHLPLFRFISPLIVGTSTTECQSSVNRRKFSWKYQIASTRSHSNSVDEIMRYKTTNILEFGLTKMEFYLTHTLLFASVILGDQQSQNCAKQRCKVFKSH